MSNAPTPRRTFLGGAVAAAAAAALPAGLRAAQPSRTAPDDWIAEVPGQHQLSFTRHDVCLNIQQFSANLGPGQTANKTDFIVLTFLIRQEPHRTENFRQHPDIDPDSVSCT